MRAGLSRTTHSSPQKGHLSITRPHPAGLFICISILTFVLLILSAACRNDGEAQRVRPRQLRDVPAQRLAFSFQPDIGVPPGLTNEEASKLAAIQQDFDMRRKDDALLRTIGSPDGQRALALYGTADEPSQTFRIDLYSSDGKFLRNLTPATLAVVFQDSVVWSPDGGYIAFVGRKALAPVPSPTPDEEELAVPSGTPAQAGSPAPTAVAPVFAPLPVFNTEQVYLCNRDGYDLKPLTTRDGLIYFALAWAPDSHALVALACKESEWDAREKEFKTPAGRPRLISTDGHERLLDDALAEAPPVWSPDSSKVATAFGVDVGIYDAAGKAPTQARIALRERLLSASAAFDQKAEAGKKKAANTTAASGTSDNVPVSFNPIVRLEWPAAEKLYVETAYVTFRSELIKTFSRWHLLSLTPQAVILGRG
jgi:hypothetical protein